MATSSSLSSENEGKNHTFQNLTEPGPKGAYEARQVNGGFYVRIDMPGVPQEGVKLRKRGETNTVTFTGKAPMMWPDGEKSDRVYGGYIVLDRNPDEVDVEMAVVNGSLKLFFPASDGLLHFFASKKRVTRQCSGSLQHLGDLIDCCHNKLVRSLDEFDDRLTQGLKLHPPGCTCCIEDKRNVARYDEDTMITTHINPSLLDGMEGVLGRHKVIDATGERMHIRVDLPGLAEKNMSIRKVNGVAVICLGQGTKEHHLDQGSRTYAGGWILNCKCCKIIDVKHEMNHGVLMVSFRRRNNRSSSDNCKISLITNKDLTMP